MDKAIALQADYKRTKIRLTNYGWKRLEDDGRRTRAVWAQVGTGMERSRPGREQGMVGGWNGEGLDAGKCDWRVLGLTFSSHKSGHRLGLFPVVLTDDQPRRFRGVIASLDGHRMRVGMRVNLGPVVVLRGMATIEMCVDKRSPHRGARERQ